MVRFNNKSRPRSKEDKENKEDTESAYAVYEGRELNLKAFKSRIFPIKKHKEKD